jgi:hypothetical protein
MILTYNRQNIFIIQATGLTCDVVAKYSGCDDGAAGRKKSFQVLGRRKKSFFFFVAEAHDKQARVLVSGKPFFVLIKTTTYPN